MCIVEILVSFLLTNIKEMSHNVQVSLEFVMFLNNLDNFRTV